MVIHHTKNYLLYKDATCHNLWPCDFTDVTAFSSVFFLELASFSTCSTFYGFFSLKLFFMVVMFFFKGTFLP